MPGRPSFEDYLASINVCAECGQPATVVVIPTDNEYRERTGMRNTKFCRGCFTEWHRGGAQHIARKMADYYDMGYLRKQWEKLAR